MDYRRLIGYCQQRCNLNLLLTIRENLYSAGRYYGMSKQEITHRFNELNTQLGINKHLDNYSKELSGG